MKLGHLSKTERQALKALVTRVRSKLRNKVDSVCLFGSRARGEGTEESDLDVLVLLKSVDMKAKHAIWDIANDIFLDTWINISPLVMSKSQFRELTLRERLLAKEIHKDGIKL